MIKLIILNIISEATVTLENLTFSSTGRTQFTLLFSKHKLTSKQAGMNPSSVQCSAYSFKSELSKMNSRQVARSFSCCKYPATNQTKPLYFIHFFSCVDIKALTQTAVCSSEPLAKNFYAGWGFKRTYILQNTPLKSEGTPDMTDTPLWLQTALGWGGALLATSDPWLTRPTTWNSHGLKSMVWYLKGILEKFLIKRNTV